MASYGGSPHGVDGDVLGRVAREALRVDSAEVIGWRSRSIWEPRLASTRGVYLVTTELVVDGKPRALALVLKALARSDSGGTPREAELYRSGALSSLHGGLVAPCCFGVADLPDGSLGVWLEHVEDAIGPAWPIARFALAAFHLGELAALDSGPAAALARGASRRDYCALSDLVADNLDRLQRASDHPLVRRAYPSHVLEGLLALWRDRGPILAALDRVPDAVCHGDAQRRNLFARRDGAGREETVAVDWANFATAPIGMDVATLVHYALVYFDAGVADAADLDRRACDGYVAGLRAGGWQGDPRLVRFGYAAQLALGLGLSEIHPVLRLALDERRHAWADGFYGRPIGQILDRRARVGEYLVELGREARAYVNSVC